MSADIYILSQTLLKKMHSVKAQGILLEEKLSDFVQFLNFSLILEADTNLYPLGIVDALSIADSFNLL